MVGSAGNFNKCFEIWASIQLKPVERHGSNNLNSALCVYQALSAIHEGSHETGYNPFKIKLYVTSACDGRYNWIIS